MEGSMIWERCKREAPATGLGRSLFTPLPRHVSVFDCEARSVIYSWKVESGEWLAAPNLHLLDVTATTRTRVSFLSLQTKRVASWALEGL